MKKKRTRFELRLNNQELAALRKLARVGNTDCSALIRAHIRNAAIRKGVWYDLS